MRAALMAVAIGLSFIGLAAAADADAAIKTNTNIPAQKLRPALQSLATTLDVQLLYRTDVVGDRTTKGASGAATPDEALTQLLEGTGLTFQYLGEKAITIVPLSTKEGSVFLPESERWTQLAGPSASTAPKEQLIPASPRRFRVARLDQAESRGSSTTESAASSSQEGSRKTLEEIVVTAQKREERLQDVPISISVLGGESLDRSSVESITDALRAVPGVDATVAAFTGETVLNVRGVGANFPVFGGSSPVSYYLDSVPYGFIKSAVVPDSGAYDLDRVEVLRGPQGTLYGAGGVGGVVRVLTKDANLSEVEFKARTTLSNTDEGAASYRGDMAVNVPLIEDKLAARAVIGYQDQGGWIDRPFGSGRDANDLKMFTGRLKVNSKPTERLSIGLSAWISRRDDGAPPVGNEDWVNVSIFDEVISADYEVYAVTVGYDLPWVSITSATSLLNYENDAVVDRSPATSSRSINNRFSSEVFAEEINFNSVDAGPWRWSAGLYYRDAKDNLFQAFTPQILPANIDFTDESEAYAVFGQVGRRILSDKLELSVGLRYFHDDVINQENIQHQGLPNVPLLRQEASFDSTTPRVVLQWYPDDDFTLYASYAEGFRSGFPQNPNIETLVPGYPALKPDKLTNYEVGAKGAFLDRRLIVDAALYYMDWKDVQQLSVVEFGTVVFTAPINGRSASGPGIDLGVTALPGAGFEFGATVSWNDLTLDGPVSNVSGLLLFEDGDRLNFSPEYTASIFADYEFSLGGTGLTGKLSTSANLTAAQHVYSVLGGLRDERQGDDLFTAQASFTIRSPQSHWSTMIFADNLTNENNGYPSMFGSVADTDKFRPRLRPRTIGLQLDYQF